MPIRETRRKYKVRVRNRCSRCGRPRGYRRRRFGPPIPTRELASEWEDPWRSSPVGDEVLG